jgi:hypothetical protein
MKNLLIVVAMVIWHVSFGQNAQEWTRQKKTQIKYLLQQIAANKVYIEYVEKGYSIASKGLQTIRDIKKGDFNLSFDFFESQKKVNPEIKNWVKVADIIAYQIRIIKAAKQTILDVKETGQFTNDELDYCKAVFDNLLNECIKNIDELVDVITNGNFEMKDNERMDRIDKLYIDMQDKYSFTSSFSEEMGVLSAQRISEQAEVNLSKKLNGVR